MVENVEYTVDLLSSVVKIEYAKKVPAAAKLKVFLLKTSVDPNEFTLLSLEDGTTMPITEEQIGLPSSSYHQPDYNEAGSPYDKTVPRGAAVYQDPTTHRFYWYRRGQARNVPFDWIYMGVK
eukprot:TRINITY_DN58931_c0_g2_i2.p1 TRINITY_DN58931_c0_g2~~TRINITY_DN58931_c0_g2_i2.p1  ORF type:complete len:122 (-),score=11.90 TRINITY_DN58931_c0_g2_i2:190-555(-)